MRRSPTYAATRCWSPPRTSSPSAVSPTPGSPTSPSAWAPVPALVIYYFGTKDSLLTEALRWSERSFYASVEEMLQGTPKLRARIENLVDSCLPASKDVPDDWGLWFDLWAQAFRHPEVKKDRAALDQQWRDLITRVVQAGVDAGEIGALDVEAFTVMWTALLDGLVVQVALEDPVVDAALAKRIALDVAVKELGLS